MAWNLDKTVVRCALVRVASFAAAFVAIAHLHAEVRYTITPLGLGGSSGLAFSVNGSGQVAGTGSTIGDVSRRGFFYDGASVVELGTHQVNYTSTEARGINDIGQVVGFAFTEDGYYNALAWSGGSVLDIGASNGGPSSSAFGINIHGEIVGEAFYPGDSYSYAFRYSNAAMLNLGSLGGPTSVARGINDNSEVVGWAQTAVRDPNDFTQFITHAFLYSGGTMTDLGTLGSTPTYLYSHANAINDNGQVVGAVSPRFRGGDNSRAFLYSEDQMIDLSGSSLGSEAIDINKVGDVVGWASFDANEVSRAFLYSGGVMTDLNDLIDPTSGWLLTGATSINDIGQIVGYGRFDGGTDQLAFLLAPIGVPEPGLATMFVLAGAGLLMDGRRARARLR